MKKHGGFVLELNKELSSDKADDFHAQSLEDSITANKEIILSERLTAIAAAVPHSKRVFDIGSDHGYIGAYLLENGIAETLIATDIRESPANRTRNFLSERGLSARSQVFCTDGVRGLTLEADDTVLICGMGGYAIIDILADILKTQDRCILKHVSFLLQPQKSLVECRLFLYQNGFSLHDETLCFDRGKWYVIFHVNYSDISEQIPSLTELFLGPCLMKKKQCREYLLYQQQVLQKIILGRPEYINVLKNLEKMLEVNDAYL